MRAIGVIVFIIVVLVYYLGTTYVNFFDNIGIANLTPPLSDSSYYLGEKSGDKKTFTFIGDSLTAGVGTTDLKNTIPYQTTINLAKSHYVTVRVFGYPGARVNSILPVSELQKKEKSDLTIIFIGINDVFNRTPINKFNHDLDTVVSNMKLNSKKTILLTLPFLGTKTSVPFPYDFLYDYQLRKYNKEIKSIAEKYDIQLIDLYELTNGHLKDEALFASDNFHPSDSGFILIADIITKELSK